MALVKLSITTKMIAEAVVIRTSYGSEQRVFELSADEARALRNNLDTCLGNIDSGKSVCVDARSFLNTLPRRRTV